MASEKTLEEGKAREAELGKINLSVNDPPYTTGEEEVIQVQLNTMDGGERLGDRKDDGQMIRHVNGEARKKDQDVDKCRGLEGENVGQEPTAEL